jgi:hypothetical protein
MSSVFAQEIAEVEGLAEADQEQIGRQLLSHVEKVLSENRADKGIRPSMQAREQLDIEFEKNGRSLPQGTARSR